MLYLILVGVLLIIVMVGIYVVGMSFWIEEFKCVKLFLIMCWMGWVF